MGATVGDGSEQDLQHKLTLLPPPNEIDKQGDVIPDWATVSVNYGALKGLQAKADSVDEVIADAKGFLRDIAGALGIGVVLDKTPDELVNDVILPRIAGLMLVQGLVNQAEDELRQRADSLEVPVLDLGGGRKAVQVGRRLPPGYLEGKT